MCCGCPCALSPGQVASGVCCVTSVISGGTSTGCGSHSARHSHFRLTLFICLWAPSSDWRSPSSLGRETHLHSVTLGMSSLHEDAVWAQVGGVARARVAAAADAKTLCAARRRRRRAAVWAARCGGDGGGAGLMAARENRECSQQAHGIPDDYMQPAWCRMGQCGAVCCSRQWIAVSKATL